MNRLKLNIFLVLLILLIVLSIIPIAILINQSIDNLDIIKGVSKEAIGAIVREQSDQVYKSRARDLAQRISDFLKASSWMCEFYPKSRERRKPIYIFFKLILVF